MFKHIVPASCMHINFEERTIKTVNNDCGDFPNLKRHTRVLAQLPEAREEAELLLTWSRRHRSQGHSILASVYTKQ